MTDEPITGSASQLLAEAAMEIDRLQRQIGRLRAENQTLRNFLRGIQSSVDLALLNRDS